MPTSYSQESTVLFKPGIAISVYLWRVPMSFLFLLHHDVCGEQRATVHW